MTSQSLKMKEGTRLLGPEVGYKNSENKELCIKNRRKKNN